MSSSVYGTRQAKRNSTAYDRFPTTTRTPSCSASVYVYPPPTPNHSPPSQVNRDTLELQSSSCSLRIHTTAALTCHPSTPGRLPRLARKRRDEMGRRDSRKLPGRQARARRAEVRPARDARRHGRRRRAAGAEEAADRLQAGAGRGGADPGVTIPG